MSCSFRDPSTWALNEAKQNVQDHYVAVGLLEELEDTFRVFEKVLPDAFDGVLDVYRNIGKVLRKSEQFEGCRMWKAALGL